MDYQLDNSQEKQKGLFFLLYLKRDNHHEQWKQLKV